MALEFVSGLKKKLSNEYKKRVIRNKQNKGKGLASKILDAPTSSSVNWAKVAAKRINEETARQAQKKKDALETRKVQLSKMPKGRGMKELARLNETGSMKQTKVEKEAEARKKQLAGMPKGRGKSVSKEEAKKAAEKQETEKRSVSKESKGATDKPVDKKEEKGKGKKSKVKKLVEGLASRKNKSRY